MLPEQKAIQMWKQKLSDINSAIADELAGFEYMLLSDNEANQAYYQMIKEAAQDKYDYHFVKEQLKLAKERLLEYMKG